MKSDVTIVFLDPDFLYDTGIPAICEHCRQKLDFQDFLAQNGGRVVDVDPDKLVVTSDGVPVFFHNVCGFY